MAENLISTAAASPRTQRAIPRSLKESIRE